jgi:Kef-type K+ transport system membrane component KefB/nucleotide-binding universal stress UspA family protein
MRSATTYLLLGAAPFVLLLLILSAGGDLVARVPAAASAPGLVGTEPHFLPVLLLQIGAILIVARATGAIFRRLHQPQVVGEMVAGILLGPSLLGWVAPDLFGALFPPGSLGYLDALSQAGLILFMFLIGLELDTRLLRGRQRAALVTGHISIVVPFVLGAALALFLYPRLAETPVEFVGFALFMGASMSITAFPVLARILAERNLIRTHVGVIAIACAAINDVAAWTILAVLIAVVRSDAAATPIWLTLAGSGAYALVMVFVVRRALRWLESFYHSRGRLTQDALALTLLLLLASAWTTEWLGIHALFGAFLFGAVMPKDPGLVHDITEKLEDVTVVFLLPLFFAFTGLRTSIGLVSGAEQWLFAGLILFVAVAGKFGGAALAARLTGMGWRESAALGVLMNTRGLMELVILTIGLDLGVISPTLFAMMVMMALATTFMTTPLLELVYPARLIRQRALAEPSDPTSFTILVPVSLASSGPVLLNAARLVAPPRQELVVYALHLHVADEQSLSRMTRPAEERVLQPLLEAAALSGAHARALSFVSRRPGRDIADVARIKRADLLLMGYHRPVITRNILGGTVQEVLSAADCDVAVLIDRGNAPWRRILVPHSGSEHDDGAVELARRAVSNGAGSLVVLQVVQPGEHAPALADLPDGARVVVIHSTDPIAAAADEAARGYDLLIAGVSRDWGLGPEWFGRREEQLARTETASLIIVRIARGVAHVK